LLQEDAGVTSDKLSAARLPARRLGLRRLSPSFCQSRALASQGATDGANFLDELAQRVDEIIGDQAAVDELAPLVADHQTGGFEHAQMLRDRGLRDVKACRDLARAELGMGEVGEDLSGARSTRGLRRHAAWMVGPMATRAAQFCGSAAGGLAADDGVSGRSWLMKILTNTFSILILVFQERH
jgi:hypothetical protein